MSNILAARQNAIEFTAKLDEAAENGRFLYGERLSNITTYFFLTESGQLLEYVVSDTGQRSAEITSDYPFVADPYGLPDFFPDKRDWFMFAGHELASMFQSDSTLKGTQHG